MSAESADPPLTREQRTSVASHTSAAEERTQRDELRGSRRDQLLFAAVLLAAAAFVRLSDWLLPVEDPDVGVYLHVAIAWLHGHLPYITAWEYKPPGLFALYAVALKATGERPTLAVQSLATLATWATALGLWRIGPLVDPVGGARTGRYAAIFAVLLSPENEGYLGDAEVLVVPFIAWALVVAMRRPRAMRTALWCGLLCGGALQMKLTALPLIVPIAFIVVRCARRPLATAALAAAAALAPFGLEAALYASAGASSALWDANVGATWRRFTGLHRGIVSENIAWIWRQIRIMAPPLELAAVATALRVRDAAVFAATWGWLLAAIVAVVGPGEFYNRQFVLMQAPVALLGAIGLRMASDVTGRRAGAVAFLVFVTTFALHDYWKTEQGLVRVQHWDLLGERSWREPGYDRDLSLLRRADVHSLYVIELTPLLYDVVGAAAPTRFADSDLLLEKRMRPMIGQNGAHELARIFAHKPRFVIVGGPLSETRFDRHSVAFVHAQLAHEYRRAGSNGYATLYERRPPRIRTGKPRR